MSGFSFRGVHSSKFGIYTQDTDRIILPPRREERIVIPGRSGYYDGVAGNIYDERTETIHCAFKCPSGRSVPEICREIAYWLSGIGRLTYDKEPDKYYMACISGGPPMAQHLKYGEFDLTWSYNLPFAFGPVITAPLVMGPNHLAYRGTVPAPCLIVLRNLSDTDVQTVTITAVKRSE